MRRSLALLLLITAAAHADTLRKAEAIWSASQEGEIVRKVEQVRDQILVGLELADAFLQNNTPIEARVDVVAEAGAGVDDRGFAAQGSAAVVFAVRQERCDLLQAGLGIRGDLRSRSPHTLGGMQEWASICLSGGLDLGPLVEGSDAPGLSVFPMVVRESALMLARPRLTAPRAAIDEEYSDVGFGFDVEGMRYRWAEANGMAYIGFSADQRWRWRHFYGGEKSKVELTSDIWLFRLFHTRGETALADRYVDFIVIGLHGIQADNGAAIINFVPLRISGLALFGTDAVLVDAEWGIAGTGTISSETSGPGANSMTTIDTTDLPDVTAQTTHLAVHAGDVYRSLSAAYDRTVDTNILADVIVEDRFSLSAQRTETAWLARGAAFVSRAKYFLDEDTRAEERVLGFAFSGSYRLPRNLDVGVTLEGVFGKDDRDPLLDGHALPRGLRAFVTLGTTQTLWTYKPD